MRCVSVCVLAAAAALVWAGSARAEREAEYTRPGSGTAPKPAAPKPGNASPLRPAMFAAASAANARKMSAEQREERRFLRDAAAASRFETEASRMVLAKSSNAAVRAFAATLINHHASTSIALQHMLHGRGMAAPMLANDQRKTLNRLAKLGGAKFDREYTEEVALRYQQQGLQSYEQAAVTVQDAALKGWIVRTLPTLRYQVASAERLVTPGRRSNDSVNPRGNERATQFMGAGAMQLGVTQPVASRPIESSNR
jgi:predicted outer membrane protein